jgi:hypothetical protein
LRLAQPAALDLGAWATRAAQAWKPALPMFAPSEFKAG